MLLGCVLSVVGDFMDVEASGSCARFVGSCGEPRSEQRSSEIRARPESELQLGDFYDIRSFGIEQVGDIS